MLFFAFESFRRNSPGTGFLFLTLVLSTDFKSNDDSDTFFVLPLMRTESSTHGVLGSTWSWYFFWLLVVTPSCSWFHFVLPIEGVIPHCPFIGHTSGNHTQHTYDLLLGVIKLLKLPSVVVLFWSRSVGLCTSAVCFSLSSRAKLGYRLSNDSFDHNISHALHSVAVSLCLDISLLHKYESSSRISWRVVIKV